MRSFETNLDDNKYIASVEKVKIDKPTIFSIVVTPIEKKFCAQFYCNAKFNEQWSLNSNIVSVKFN